MDTIQELSQEPEPLPSKIHLTKSNLLKFDFRHRKFSFDKEDFLDFNARPLTVSRLSKFLDQINPILKDPRNSKDFKLRKRCCLFLIFFLFSVVLSEICILSLLSTTRLSNTKLKKELVFALCLICYALLAISYAVFLKNFTISDSKIMGQLRKIKSAVDQENKGDIGQMGFFICLNTRENSPQKGKAYKYSPISFEFSKNPKNILKNLSLSLINTKKVLMKCRDNLEKILKSELNKKECNLGMKDTALEEDSQVYETESNLIKMHETYNPSFEFSNAEYQFPHYLGSLLNSFNEELSHFDEELGPGLKRKSFRMLRKDAELVDLGDSGDAQSQDLVDFLGM